MKSIIVLLSSLIAASTATISPLNETSKVVSVAGDGAKGVYVCKDVNFERTNGKLTEALAITSLLFDE
jgi:hypothetical protein